MQTLIILSCSVILLFILAVAFLFSSLKKGFRLFIILLLLAMGTSLATLILSIIALFTNKGSLPITLIAIIISVTCLYFSLTRITQGQNMNQP
jgi:hypothetical protein